MPEMQHTIKRNISFSGAGIHTAWDGFDTGASTDDDYLRGFAIHDSALYWAIQDANVKSSFSE